MTRTVVRFGAYKLAWEEEELRKSGVRVRLQGQPLQILKVLLERPGEIVTRDELRRALWPDDTFVDFEHGLNAAVNKLRETLNDTAANPRFIETVPRRGYRFIAQVDPPATGSGGLSHLESAAMPGHESINPTGNGDLQKWASIGHFKGSGWRLAVALVVLAAIMAAAGWGLRSSTPGAVDAPVAVPLTTYDGLERNPALSPDGSQVAFEWNKGDDRWHIYVKIAGPGEPVRLTTANADEFNPAWSPDGRQIAFIRRVPGEEVQSDLFLIPALGGVERKLATSLLPSYWSSRRLMSWTPDGRHLIVATREEVGGGSGLLIVPAAGGEPRWLLPPSVIPGDVHPAVSPDGRSIAFIRKPAQSQADVYVMKLAGIGPSGEPRRLTHLDRHLFGLAWTPDTKSILVSAGYDFHPLLYRASLQGGEPIPLFSLGRGALAPSISKTGTLVFTRFATNRTIWRQEVTQRPDPLPPSVKLISSTAVDRNPSYSPDGTRIAFQSGRSGLPQIWTCASDGSQCVQLTHSFTGPEVGSPRWSPDGKWIVFDSAESGTFDIYLIASRGGEPRRLTDHPAEDAIPSFSHDGKWIYFMSDRSGAQEIWRMPSSGGEAVQITQSGGHQALESHDGTALYYSQRQGITSLWKKSLDGSGGPDVKIADAVYPMNFALSRERLYYVKAEPDGGGQLRYRHLTTGKDVLLVGKMERFDIGLSASPDGRYVLGTRVERDSSDLMLVENFR